MNPNSYLDDWDHRRAQRAEEATDRYLGRHPVWGESCDQIMAIHRWVRDEAAIQAREAKMAAQRTPLRRVR